MVFWRKKKNITTQERDEHDERILHRPSDPALEPPTEYDSEIDPDFAEHELCEDEAEILEELDETPCRSVPFPMRKRMTERMTIQAKGAGFRA
ncbi:MAG: hypothetical protein R3D66_04190 [Alphaproteobacteria bacterium]